VLWGLTDDFCGSHPGRKMGSGLPSPAFYIPFFPLKTSSHSELFSPFSQWGSGAGPNFSFFRPASLKINLE